MSLTIKTFFSTDLGMAASDGDVDWNSLGNMLSAHILGEVLCASYVDYKYGQRTKAFKAQTDWQ
jgi:hypothetical protein